MADAIFTEQEKEYIENTDADSATVFRELRRLNTKIDELNAKVEPKSDEDRKKEIMSIKSKTDRLKAIEDNIDLWR